MPVVSESLQESLKCVVCLGALWEPSIVEEIPRFPPAGRVYWSGGMSFFGKLRLPDDRAYDRHAIDVLSCCHVAHITCYLQLQQRGGAGAQPMPSLPGLDCRHKEATVWASNPILPNQGEWGG